MGCFPEVKNESDYHTFVTDSVWLRELGLTTFTTGTLYQWMNKKDKFGNYQNWQYLAQAPPSSDSPSPPNLIFGYLPTTGKDIRPTGWAETHKSNDSATHVWRFTDSTKGKYELMGFGDGSAGSQTWEYTDPKKSIKYSKVGFPLRTDDLKLSEIEDKVYVRSTELTTDGNVQMGTFEDMTLEEENPDGIIDTPEVKGINKSKSISPTTIVALNDYAEFCQIH